MSLGASGQAFQSNSSRPTRYGFACGEYDSDWDFVEKVDSQSRYAAGYVFASADCPIQLRHDYGGMDEDEEVVRDVWYPPQHASSPLEDSEMSDDHSSGTEEMDIDCSNNQLHAGSIARGAQWNVPNKRKRASDVSDASVDASRCAPPHASGGLKRVKIHL